MGAFQTLITLLRIGDLTRYISHPVVVGFTLGASALLVIDQMRNLLGWSPVGAARSHFLVRTWQTWTTSGPPHGPTMLIGLGAIGLVLGLRVLRRRLRWVLFPELLLTPCRT